VGNLKTAAVRKNDYFDIDVLQYPKNGKLLNISQKQTQTATKKR